MRALLVSILFLTAAACTAPTGEGEGDEAESTEDAIFSASADGCILSWNRGATRMFGLPPEQTIGHRFAELLPSAVSALPTATSARRVAPTIA